MHAKLGLSDGCGIFKVRVIPTIETNSVKRGDLMPVLILVIGADRDEMSKREILGSN